MRFKFSPTYALVVAFMPIITLAATFASLPQYMIIMVAILSGCVGLAVVALAETQSNNRLEDAEEAHREDDDRLKEDIRKLTKTNQRYELLVASTNDAVIIVDEDGKVLEANAAFAQMLGYGPKEIGGLFLPDLAPNTERRAIKDFVGAAVNKGAAVAKDLMLSTRSGTSAWFDGCGTNVEGAGPTAQLVLKDMTESKRQFVLTEKEISFIHELSRTLPLLQDFDQMLERILSMLSDTLPFEGFTLVLAEPNDTKATICVGKATRTSFVVEIKGCVRDILFDLGDDIDPSTFEYKVEKKEGIVSSGTTVGSQIMLPLAVVNGFAGLFSSKENAFKKEDLSLFSTMVSGISSLYIAYKSYQQVQHMSVTDSLTGLYNRRKFFEEIEREVDRVSRYGSPLSVIMLDLDHFKNINDEFGHQMGDEILRELADVLRSATRKTDTIARYGGEEFIIMLAETGLEGAVMVADRIRAAIEEAAVLAAAVEIKFTASLGVAAFVKGDTVDALVGRADTALYAAKENGRNCVERIAL